ncbi:hotdog fold thioesterase [Dongshaea marina]|uniref:hotdog fold thioesterase n=1 Tax=Dongshaea marina TaxID=2047966 RepID=UPI000D3E2538|nr:hotdog fold thioesterase [Dongshaea marina]
MSIWKKDFTLESLNQMSDHTMIEHLGIKYQLKGEESLEASMPVDSRTHQPLGMLHGGASVVLAETLGSVAGNMCVEADSYCVGTEINASHIRAKRRGVVTGRARPLHLGQSSQVWQIDILDEQQRLICSCRLANRVLKKKKSSIREA